MKTTKGYAAETSDGTPLLSAYLANGKYDGDRAARIVWESDWKKLMKLVRDQAQRGCSHSHPVAKEDNPMVVSMEPCGVCLSCRAKKLTGRKT